MQEEAAKAAKVREQTVARLQQLEKQKAQVELAKDELKVCTGRLGKGAGPGSIAQLFLKQGTGSAWARTLYPLH